MAVFGSGFCVMQVWKMYESSFTKTTILSTLYPYAHTPFPSVTICETSRVYNTVLKSLYVDFWRTFPKALKSYNIILKYERVFLRYQNASGRSGSYEEALLNMMNVLATNRLPLFEDFNKMKKWEKHFNELNKLNISDLLLKVYIIKTIKFKKLK